VPDWLSNARKGMLISKYELDNTDRRFLSRHDANSLREHQCKP
jgi:hypothetical protein